MIRKATSVASALAVLALFSANTFAQEAGAAAAHTGMSDTAWKFIAAGFGMSIAAAVCAFSQSRGIAAAVSATARNPQAGGRIFTMMLLGLAFIETMALLTFVIISGLK